MSAKIDRLFSDYSEHHQATGNVVCHFIGIPMIAAGLFGLLAVELYRVGGLPLEVTVVLMVLLTPVSGALDWRLTAALTLVYVGLTWARGCCPGRSTWGCSSPGGYSSSSGMRTMRNAHPLL